MPTLEHNRLVFRFPQIEKEASFSIDFQRTLRIPDSDETYPLPPGLGSFPLRHVEDHADKLPAQTTSRGGVILPMWQAEAMWLNFSNRGARLGSRFPGRHQGGGRQDQRRDRRGMAYRAPSRSPGLHGLTRTTLA